MLVEFSKMFVAWPGEISSIPPINLSERGGGRTKMRKKSGRCKMFWGLFLDACRVFQDVCGLERNMMKNMLQGVIF